MTIFYVIRHAQTFSNMSGKIIGQHDSPITHKGKIEIDKVLRKLSGIRFGNIYSSDLGRARQTSEIVAKTINYRRTVRYVKSLREIDYGELTGLDKEYVIKRYPLYHKDVNFVNPSGESFNDLYSRVIKFIRQIENKSGTHLIITHSGCIRAIYAYFCGLEFQEVINMPLGHDTIVKCSRIRNVRRAKIL